MPIIPIIPSINTCMSLTTTTTTTSTKTITSVPAVPEMNTSQLQALADVCSTVNSSSALNPISNPIMNSLVSPTKVVTNDDIVNPIPTCVASNIELPKKIPISLVAAPIMHSSTEIDDLNHVENVTNSELQIEQQAQEASESVVAVEDAIDSTAAGDHVENNKLEHTENKNGLERDQEIAVNENKNNVQIHESVETNPHNDLIIETMLDEQNLSPSSACNEPMECSSLASQNSPKEKLLTSTVSNVVTNEDVIMSETASLHEFNVS